MNKITTKKYRVNDIFINVAEAGIGEKLVLIHGWSNSWVGWTLLAHQLAPHYHLYMLDLPGFGDSDRLEKYTLEIAATYVNKFIKDYVNSPKALIAGSGGTFVAAETCKQSHLDTNLVFIGTLFKKKRIQILADAYKKVLEFSQDKLFPQKIFEKVIQSPYSAYFVEKYINAYQFNKLLVDAYQVPGRKKITGKSYVQMGIGFADFIMEDFLAKTQNPTLLLFGEADNYVRPEEANEMVSKLSNKKLALKFISSAGHNPAYEQPQQTANEIRNFLKH